MNRDYRDPRIVRALIDAGYSVGTVATIAGVSPAAISHLVNGGDARLGSSDSGVALASPPSLCFLIDQLNDCECQQ